MAGSHRPLVEMLWEPHDPLRALEARFGFRDPGSAGRWVAGTLAEHWGVRIASCDRIVISDRNALAWVETPGGQLVAKWSVATDRFAFLQELARLTSWLDGRGLPVSAPLPARDGRIQVEVDGVSIGLQRRIAGELLDVANPDQVTAAGAVLARLQDALAAYPDADRAGAPRPSGPPRPLTDRITDWLDRGHPQLPATAGDTLRGLIADAPPTRCRHNSATGTSAPPTSCAPAPTSSRSSTSSSCGTITGSSSWHARPSCSGPGSATGDPSRLTSTPGSSRVTDPYAR